MKAPLIHVASLVFNEPLAILPSKLETILHAIGPRLVVDDASLDELLRMRSIQTRPVLQGNAVMLANPALSSNAYADTSANIISTITGGSGVVQVGDTVTVAQLPRQNGNDDNGKPYRLTPEGVAVLPVRGTLMKRFNFLSVASGLTTYSGLAQDTKAALSDPQVKAVLFDIDSPGGTTHGCFELSDMIYGLRGEKPMWACANDLAASAAYAVASSADRIFLTRTAGVGSVGVFALHTDQSAQDEQIGVKYSYIFAGDKKIDGNPHEPLTKSARSDIQAEVDREYEIFVMTVARNRGFVGATVGNIRGTRAGVYFAENACPLMADEVGTCDDALEALTAKVNGTRLKGSGKLAIETQSGNNASDTAQAKEGEAMPNTTEETKRAAKAEEADAKAKATDEKRDDEDEDDVPQDAKGKKAKKDDEDDEDDTSAKSRRAPVAEIPVSANAPAKRIAELCMIAGAPELTGDYIMRGYSVEKVIEKLSARRVKASSEGNVNSFVAGDGEGSGGGGQASVDAAIKQSRIMSANSGGALKPSQCMERILRSSPEVYSGYLEEKDRVMSQISYSGGGRILNDYILNTQRRYMAQLGLGTAIEDVPSRRPM